MRGRLLIRHRWMERAYLRLLDRAMANVASGVAHGLRHEVSILERR